MASSPFDYDCEAVRVHARRLHPRTGSEEQRRFSVDPNLTTFDILRSILVISTLYYIPCRTTVYPKDGTTLYTPLFSTLCGRIAKPFELQIVHMCGFDMTYDMP